MVLLFTSGLYKVCTLRAEPLLFLFALILITKEKVLLAGCKVWSRVVNSNMADTSPSASLHVLCNRSCRMFCFVFSSSYPYCKTALIVSASKRSKAISSERMTAFATKRFCCVFTRLRVVKLVDNGNMAQSKIVFVCKLTSASCSRFVLKLDHSLINLLTTILFLLI